MKFLLSTALLVITFTCLVFGYNEFLIENREADKCETCKYFMEFYNTNSNLNIDDVEEVYREFFELAQTGDEDVCLNFCVNEEFVEPSQEVDTSDEESSENLVDNLIAHVGCATCMHIVQNVNKHIRFYGFRGIIDGFKYACFNDVTLVCKSFLAHHEDELIDAIYHFKNHTIPVCKSIHQC